MKLWRAAITSYFKPFGRKAKLLSIKKNRIKPFKLFLELSLALCYKIFRQYLYIYFRFIDKLVTFSCKRDMFY